MSKSTPQQQQCTATKQSAVQGEEETSTGTIRSSTPQSQTMSGNGNNGRADATTPVATRNMTLASASGRSDSPPQVPRGEDEPAPTHRPLALDRRKPSSRSFQGLPKRSKVPSALRTGGCRNIGIVMGDFTGLFPDELSLKMGERVEILCKDVKVTRNIGWWTGKNEKGQVGIFPIDCVKVVSKAQAESGEAATAVPKVYPMEIGKDELELKEIIGAGGFGKVHRGIYRNEEVAVKVARNTTYDSVKAIKDVLSEAEKFSRFAHQNICALVGVCLVNDICLVMEYSRGSSLNKVLHENNITLPVDVILDWATQIACGMKYLHHEVSPSLIHRDLKSSNSKS